jgi:hypothetical protein
MQRRKPLFRHGAPGWVELSVAITAVIASAASLYIARQQTNVMHRQLAASIWPAMQYSTSNLRAGEPVITMSLENVGVGPARIHEFRLLHEGRAIDDLTQFIAECCAPADAPVRTITSFVEGRIVPAGQRVDFLTLPADPAQPGIYERFDRVRGQVEIELCYCSVLEECWTARVGAREPESVRRCSR